MFDISPGNDWYFWVVIFEPVIEGFFIDVYHKIDRSDESEHNSDVFLNKIDHAKVIEVILNLFLKYSAYGSGCAFIFDTSGDDIELGGANQCRD